MSDRAEDRLLRDWSLATAIRSTRVEQTLWIVIVGAVVGDVVLTVIGLRACFTEMNPVAAVLFSRYGPAGLVALKALSFGTLVGVYRYLSARFRPVALLGYAAPQLLAVWSNSLLISRRAALCAA